MGGAKKPSPSRVDGAVSGSSISERRALFVEYYMASGDPAAAYKQAGYSTTTHASTMAAAKRLLAHDEIKREIASRVYEQNAMTPVEVWMDGAAKFVQPIADREERQMFLTRVMRDEAEDMKERLKACEMLAKTQGDYTTQVQVTLVEDVRRSVSSILGLDQGFIDVTPEDD